ncbi:DUF2339 domain-containing protein [Porticoccus sp.]
MSGDIEKRLLAMEQRLAQLEARQINATNPDKQMTNEAASAWSATGQPSTSSASGTSAAQPTKKSSSWSVTKILGWGGAMALVLSVSYLIRLAISGGWLTPARQVSLAVLAGFILIATGIRLRNSDREYAGLLPAGGIVVLFLAVYGAHLYYELIGVHTAAVAVMVICIMALVLCRYFDSQLYALFAVAGSYSAPFLLGDTSGSILNLVIYYSCWSVIFSTFAIWERNRRIYLLALYMALIGFDALWKLSGSDAWLAAASFQFIQLIIFSSCAVLYAIRCNEPMTRDMAMSHAPALLIFYALEYALLDQHVPAFAPWLALASAGILLLAHQVARVYLSESLAGSKWLLSAYCGLVLLHAGYLESVPDHLGPWVALLAVGAAAVFLRFNRHAEILKGPIGWVIIGIYAANYLRLAIHFDVSQVPASELLLTLYAVQIYVGYYLVRKQPGLTNFAPLLIYSGHIAAMVAALHQFDSPFVVSLCWAVLALGSLLLALRYNNKLLGQSSLFIFATSAIKVFALDIAEAEPVIRIACLAALGISLYLGGWLYKKVERLGASAI